MPEHEYSNTATIPPEILLAAVIAEYTRATRQTLHNVRYLRKAAPAPALGECSHQTRYAIGGTGEEDQFFQCAELAAVYNFADVAEYCLRHHLKAEASR